MPDRLLAAAAEMLLTPDLAVRMFNDGPDALAIVDGDGTILLVNTQMELMTGYHRSELKGRSVEMLVPDALRERHTEHRHRYMQAPQRRPMGLGLDLRLRRKSGVEIYVDVRLSPVPTPKGIVVIAVVRPLPVTTHPAPHEEER